MTISPPQDLSGDSSSVPIRMTVEVDPRLGFLGRAAVRHMMVEAGEMSVAEAFDGLVEPFLDIVFPRPKNEAEAHWDSPGWADAAREYAENRRRQ